MKIKCKRKRTSPFWTLPKHEFVDLIKSSKSWKEIFDFFGIVNKGGNAKTLKERVILLDLDTSHFMNRNEASNLSRAVTLDEFHKWLIPNSRKDRGSIKKYILKFNLIEYSCSKCGLLGEWEGESLALHLEHKNGQSSDHSIENLCFLCPNCHSQTSTYAGKALRGTAIKNFCECGENISRESKLCLSCSAKQRSKIEWPDLDLLRQWLWERPTSVIAKELGVSGKAVEVFVKKHNLSKPPRGYWAKINKTLPPAKRGEDNHRFIKGRLYLIKNIESGETWETNTLRAFCSDRGLDEKKMRFIAIKKIIKINKNGAPCILKKHKGFTCELLMDENSSDGC
jgi:5-methylcytosine-specific restriction endonuclease McrA